MSAMNQDERAGGVQEDAAARLPTEPLSALDTYRVESDALRAAEEGRTEIMEIHRKGRVEAETHRVSEEMTREARERALAAQARVAASAPAMAAASTPAASAGAALTTPRPLEIRNVLVPVDGSTNAERAVPFGVALAQATGAHLTLAHVFGPDPALERLIDHIVIDLHRSEVTGDMPAYLDNLRQRILPTLPAHDVMLVRAPTVERGLLALAERGLADIAVLAMRSRDDGRPLVYGPVIEGLIRYGRPPVLIISPRVPLPADVAPRLGRVLVALDGSDVAEATLPIVAGLMRSGVASEVVLLNVEEAFTTRRHGEHYLARIRGQLADTAAPVPTTTRLTTLVSTGLPPELILAAAEGRPDGHEQTGEPFDLLVLATHGRGGLGRWLFGSVAEYVMARVAIPTLLVHPRA